MNKIGIVTFFYDNFNYGALLQAYALQKVLTKYVCVSEVLIIDPLRNMRFSFSELINNLKKLPINRKLLLRMNSMRKFQLESVKHSKHLTESNIKLANLEYDAFICGSDIVWCQPLKYNAYIYWLNFVEKGKKKFSYAASIGRNFNELEREMANSFLDDFDKISVREQQVISQLDDRFNNIDVVLDPTFLLQRSEWDKLCAKRLISSDYIFAFLLGDSADQRRKIKEYAKNKKIKIVTLPYMLFDIRLCDVLFGDEKLYDVSPQKFLSLIKHSEMIFTDSYHCMIFSLLYHKKFKVFYRNGKTDIRINDLLSKFNLQDYMIADEVKEVDYKQFESTLNLYRKKSFDYIKSIKEY